MQDDFLPTLIQNETEFRRERPLLWLGSLLSPFLAIGIALFSVWALGGNEYLVRVLGALGATAAVFGRFIILSGYEGGISEGSEYLTATQLFSIVTFTDIVGAAFLVFHIGIIFKIPWLGRKIGTLVQVGREVNRKNPWMKRLSFLGLILFVSFPASMTGSVGGTILGRLLGMSRLRTFSGIVIGSILGNGFMLLFSDLLNQLIDKDDPAFQLGGVLLVTAAIFFINWRFSKFTQPRTKEVSVPSPIDLKAKSAMASGFRKVS